MSVFHKPKLPAERSPFWDLIRYIVDWCESNHVTQIVGFKVKQTSSGKIFVPNSSTQVSTTSFMGEYDQSKSYFAGQTFLISTATTIDGIAVIAGLYGVPPAGTDVLGNTYSGYVPASPTGNAVPQSPLPTIGAAPNDKFYAKLILAGC